MSVFSTRIAALKAALKEAGLDAAAINPGGTFTWATGGSFALMERPTVLFLAAEGPDLAVLPHLEAESWAHLGAGAEPIFWKDEEGFDAAFAEAARRLPARRIGVEPVRLRFLETRALERAFPGAELVSMADSLADLRSVKDAEEIAALADSVAYSEAAFARTIAQIRPGMTELAVQRLLMTEMLATPGAGDLVAPLVLTGPKSALPHGHTDETEIRSGDPLLFDFAVRARGYTCDITRTIFVGHASDAHRAFYAEVERVSDLALDLAAPGMSASDFDDRVRGALEAGPFGQWALHKTGHGIGLDVHEAPQLMRGNPEMLRPGNVLAIEPGLYRPGDIGVRIEDNVVLTEGGNRRLTQSSRALTIVAEGA
ncbi:M24 family metallopeptidase [Pseudoroseicyclus sp. CXY001]|uniref:M24 family metallopeptidase n=1 Tax=Pseudoroseicyclus sp. CXY001 TaxID=3242492 RepID=UPI003570E1D0